MLGKGNVSASMLCFAYVFLFILDSFLGNPLKKGHLLKRTPCFGPIGVRFRLFQLQYTLIIQFQQASNSSKLTVSNRKRCEICSNLTIKTYQNDVIDIVLVSLWLALNIFYNFFYCFCCWLWRSHCICLGQICIGKRPKCFKASGFFRCILNNAHFFWNRSRKSKNFMIWGKVGTSANKMAYPEGTFLWWELFTQNYSLCCR